MFNIGKLVPIRFTDDEYKKFIEEYEKSGYRFQRKFCVDRLTFSNIGIVENESSYNRKELDMARKQKTELHYDLFHPKNTLDTVLKMGKASFILSLGESINMRPIKKVINESEKIFMRLPPDVQRDLKYDMDNLKKFKDFDFLRKALSLNKIMSKYRGDNEFTVLDISHREMTKLEYEKKNKLNKFKDDDTHEE